MSENSSNPPELLDEPVLVDAEPKAKWPWLIAAVGIIGLVLGAQFGLKMLMHKLTVKKEVKNAVVIEDEPHEFNALPIPKAYEKEHKPLAPNPHDSVIGQLQNKNIDHSKDELAQLKLKLRIEERRRQLENEEKMLKSSAVLDIGVPLQKSAEVSNARTSQNGNLQNPNLAYLQGISNQGVSEVEAGLFGDLRFRIRKGKVLRGVTESAVDSDLPGLIRGHLTENIYGDQGDIVLLPNGSNLIGEYRSGGIANGQVSLFVVWTRVQLSNGIYVTIDSPSSDPLGRAGMTGAVDHHYMQRFGSSLLSSFFSVSVSTFGVNGSDRYNSSAAYRQGLSSAFGTTANQEFQQYANIQNTIRPPQGTEITILVNKDLSFEEVLTRMEEQP